MADIPKIRFKEFTEPWEQRKLSEIATMHARIGWQNLRTSEFLDSGDYMLITGTDFIDGAVNFDTCHYVERERYEQDKHIQIRNGSILITKDGTLGKVAYIQGLTMPATLNAGVFNVEIKDENEVDNRYLFQYLKAPFLMDYVDKKATGGTIKHLNQNILVDFPVVLPHKAEQEKIGEYFLAIDHLITLHQRKCDDTKELKKYMLQKMFPKNGEKFPEIRFKGFTEAWEQRKVSEYANFFTGNGLNWNDISDDGEQECILYGNLYTDYGMITENIVYRTNTEIKNPVYSEYGDVLIPASDTTPTGLARATSLEKSGVLLGGDINIIRPNEGINGSCLSLALNANRKELIRLIKGTTVRHIHNSEIKDIVICLPKLETEQVRVSSYFKQLDHLITLHQRKCDTLKELKKYMLQNMFPKKG